MKTLRFTYEMRTQFADLIWNHHYTLKCMPESSGRQRIEGCEVCIAPEGQNCESRDGFGNRMIFGSIPDGHDSFAVIVTGRAVTGLDEREPISDPARLGSYLVQTGYTRPGKALREYYREQICGRIGGSRDFPSLSYEPLTQLGTAPSVSAPVGAKRPPSGSPAPARNACHRHAAPHRGSNEAASHNLYCKTMAVSLAERPLDAALCIMERLERDYRYCQGVTDVGTTAEEAWCAGGGVCQDWCHIMLCLCRMAGIPCRYVVGMLIGEGYSHAWVEIAQEGFWYAVDPTNHKVVGDEHIKISCGRDYRDCIVSRGIFKGRAEQEQNVRVVVEEDDESGKGKVN